MKFLFDNNLPHPIASALRILHQPTLHVRDVPDLGASAPDELILAYAGRHGYHIVTRDHAIKRTPQYRAIIVDQKIGIFFVSSGRARHLTGWELAKLIIKAWDGVQRYAAGHQVPFLALIRKNGRVSSMKGSR
ncbi:MAG: DUF5615 family PIN-like protein [Gemmatimonadota bacterium]